MNFHGQDRVTIDWTLVGDLDDVINQAVTRIKDLIEDPDKHFAGVSVRWDNENGRTFLCQVQYDDTGSAK